MGKLTQTRWEKGWLELLLEKANNLNKKMDLAIPGFNTVTYKEEYAFIRNNYYLDQRSFL